MGIYIRIVKDREKNGIGYYLVSTRDFGGANFYIGINKQCRKISIYDSRSLNNLLGEIDCTKDNPVRVIGNIPVAILSRVIMRTIKSFDMRVFPEYLSYEA